MILLAVILFFCADLLAQPPTPTLVVTQPDQYVFADPGRCVEDQTIYNLTTHQFKRCDQSGVWQTTSGGATIPSTTSTLKGDGAGNATPVVGTGSDCVHPDGTATACTGGGATIAVTTNLINGDNMGNGSNSGIPPANVIVSTASYSNPGWITALANTKITGLGTAALVSSTCSGADLTGTLPGCTVVANSITLGKMATLAANSTICNNTGSAITPIACSIAQMQTLLGTNFTLVTPTIASFVNATHNHQAAAGGGTLAEAALALTNITTNDVTTSAHGFAPKGTAGTTQFWRQDWTLAVPPGGGSGCTTSGSANQVLVDNGAGGCTSSTVTIDPTAGKAGGISMPQGTANTAGANSVGFQAPTSVASAFNFTLPGAPAAGLLHATNATPSVVSVSPVVNGDITSLDASTKLTGATPVANGGWGLTTLTAHALYAGNGTSAPTALAVGATNTLLHGNTGADPSYSAIVASDITNATITGTQIVSSIALAGSPTTTTQSADDNSTKISTTAYVDRMKARGLSFSIGDPTNSSALTTSSVSQTLTVPFACTISAYNLAFSPGDTGTITVKFWKVATGTAIPTISNVINTSGVSIASGTAIHSTTTSDFTTTAVAANDMIAMVVTAVATTKSITGVLECDQ